MPACSPLLDTHERRQLLRPGQKCQFLGHHLFDSLMAKQLDEIAPNPTPMGFDDMARVDLERIEARRERAGQSRKRLVEHVTEAMRGIR